jgi:hypothetical protein
LGTAVAILILNGLAVLAGGLVSAFIPDWLIKVVAALAFLYFAVSTIASEEDEEEEEGGNLVKNKAYAIKTIEIVKNFPHKLRKGL